MLDIKHGDTVMVWNGNNRQSARYTGPDQRVEVGTFVHATIAGSRCVRRPVCAIVCRARPACW